MVSLHTLKPAPGSRRNRRRVGRGESSGWGKTSGRGTKGQKARAGGSIAPWFEGGQMPLTRRIPKRGFTNFNRVEFNVINLDRFETIETDMATPLTPELMHDMGIVKKKNVKIKILGRGELTKPLHIHAHAFSRSAVEKITAAGGKIEVIVS